MNPRPIHRWKSFWLGLFVVCFLAWGWWDSTRFETWVLKSGPSGASGLARVDGTTFVFDGARNLFAYDGVLRYPIAKSARATEEDTFEIWCPRYFKVRDIVVLFSFVVPWSAWLVWRWKREQRKWNA
jgi:hypothetical protein